jgi:hypothetical protein
MPEDLLSSRILPRHFKYHARKTLRAAYEEIFHVSEKQRAILNRWPGAGDGRCVVG